MSKKRKKPGQRRIVPLGLAPLPPAPESSPELFVVDIGETPLSPLEAYRAAHARYEALLDELDELWMKLSPEERTELDRDRPRSAAAYDTGTAITPGGQPATPPDPLPPPAPHDDLSAFLEGDSDLGALLPSRR